MTFIALYSVIMAYQYHCNGILNSENIKLQKVINDVRRKKTQDSLFHLMYKEVVNNQEKEREEAEQEIIDNYNN